jgi:hypothetical protein
MRRADERPSIAGMRSPALLLALLLAPACGDDLGAGDRTLGPGDAPDPDDREPGDPRPVPDLCARFLDCIDAIDPAELASHVAEYGPGGACWDAGPAETAVCIDACGDGLERRHRDAPRVRACMLCRSDDECDTVAGEFCFAGGCEVVEPGEFVDPPQ